MVRTVSLGIVLTITGCAGGPISKSLREEARKDITFRMVAENPEAYRGSLVIWGGEILKVQNTQTGSEMYILETPLEHRQRPKGRHHAEGRFIARTALFLDPQVYKNGTRVTVAGVIEGSRVEPLGNTQLRYPLLQLDQVAIWPPPAPVVVAPYYGWGWDWYGPDYGWWDEEWAGAPGRYSWHRW